MSPTPGQPQTARPTAGSLGRVTALCWRDTEHPEAGGSERYLREVLVAMVAGGTEATLVTARYPGSAARECVDGVRVVRLGGRLSVYPLALVAVLLARIGLGPLRGHRPDVLLDVQNGIPFLVRIVSAVPVVLLVHHVHREQWPVAGRLLGRVGWWVESVVSPRVHRRTQWLTVSLPSAHELVNLGADATRVAVVRNGVDPVPVGIGRGPSPVPTICVLSRLVPHKQVEDVLTAAATLRAELPDLVVDVLGDGWWAPHLAERTVELGLQDVVRFHGHVSEQRKHEVLDASWVHAMPSRKEGWGLAVVEAASHGVPTVGYRSSGGLADSVVDGVTGVLVGDVEGLTDALRTVLGDHGLRATLGRKALERAEDFSWDRCSAGVREVLVCAVHGVPVQGVVNAAPAV
jgi:glycosyltransferase involved in cell wall biosynthesis